MNLTINKSQVVKAGILYLLHIKLEDKDLVKVGVTCRDKIEDRVEEILRAIFVKYRYYPFCYPKRFRRVESVYDKEAQLHKLLEEYKYKTGYKFSGCTEFFDIPLDEAVAKYEELLDEDKSNDSSNS